MFFSSKQWEISPGFWAPPNLSDLKNKFRKGRISSIQNLSNLAEGAVFLAQIGLDNLDAATSEYIPSHTDVFELSTILADSNH